MQRICPTVHGTSKVLIGISIMSDSMYIDTFIYISIYILSLIIRVPINALLVPPYTLCTVDAHICITLHYTTLHHTYILHNTHIQHYTYYTHYIFIHILTRERTVSDQYHTVSNCLHHQLHTYNTV